MNGPALLALQRIDTELDHLAGRRKRLAEHAALAEAEQGHRTWRIEGDRLRAIIDEASAAIAGAESGGATIDVKKARLEAQLRTVIAPREAEALMHEIAILTSHHDDLDDIELAAMERQADAESAQHVHTGEEAPIADAVAQATEKLNGALGQLGVEEASLAERRLQAAAALSSEEQSLYDRLRKRFGGVGIAELEGQRCTGCHLDLSRSEVDIIRRSPAEELPECTQCGRLLVR